MNPTPFPNPRLCQFLINDKAAKPGMLIKFRTPWMKEARVRKIREVDGVFESITVRYGQYKDIKLEREDIIEIY
jgi:hypothetical protein